MQSLTFEPSCIYILNRFKIDHMCDGYPLTHVRYRVWQPEYCKQTFWYFLSSYPSSHPSSFPFSPYYYPTIQIWSFSFTLWYSLPLLLLLHPLPPPPQMVRKEIFFFPNPSINHRPILEETISKCDLCKALVADYELVAKSDMDVCGDNFADMRSSLIVRCNLYVLESESLPLPF